MQVRPATKVIASYRGQKILTYIYTLTRLRFFVCSNFEIGRKGPKIVVARTILIWHLIEKV